MFLSNEWNPPAIEARPQVLVADPDPAVSRALASTLYSFGMETRTAASVREALAICSQTHFEHAVTELRFDDGDGYEVIACLSRGMPECRTIVHSGHVDVATAVCAIKAGASDVLPKPSDMSLLATILLDRELGALEASPRQIRNEHIRGTVLECDGKIATAARKLLMHRRTLQRLLRREALVRRPTA